MKQWLQVGSPSQARRLSLPPYSAATATTPYRDHMRDFLYYASLLLLGIAWYWFGQ